MSPKTAAYITLVFRMYGICIVAFGLSAVAIAATAFRRAIVQSAVSKRQMTRLLPDDRPRTLAVAWVGGGLQLVLLRSGGLARYLAA